jgi:hypothetical protein
MGSQSSRRYSVIENEDHVVGVIAGAVKDTVVVVTDVDEAVGKAVDLVKNAG